MSSTIFAISDVVFGLFFTYVSPALTRSPVASIIFSLFVSPDAAFNAHGIFAAIHGVPSGVKSAIAVGAAAGNPVTISYRFDFVPYHIFPISVASASAPPAIFDISRAVLAQNAQVDWSPCRILSESFAPIPKTE